MCVSAPSGNFFVEVFTSYDIGGDGQGQRAMLNLRGTTVCLIDTHYICVNSCAVRTNSPSTSRTTAIQSTLFGKDTWTISNNAIHKVQGPAICNAQAPRNRYLPSMTQVSVRYLNNRSHIHTSGGVKGSRDPAITREGISSFLRLPRILVLPKKTIPFTHSGLASVNWIWRRCRIQWQQKHKRSAPCQRVLAVNVHYTCATRVSQQAQRSVLQYIRLGDRRRPHV